MVQLSRPPLHCFFLAFLPSKVRCTVYGLPRFTVRSSSYCARRFLLARCINSSLAPLCLSPSEAHFIFSDATSLTLITRARAPAPAPASYPPRPPPLPPRACDAFIFPDNVVIFGDLLGLGLLPLLALEEACASCSSSALSRCPRVSRKTRGSPSLAPRRRLAVGGSCGGPEGLLALVLRAIAVPLASSLAALSLAYPSVSIR